MRFFFLCMMFGAFLCHDISTVQAKTVRDILIGYSYKGGDTPFLKADIIVKNTGKVLVALKYSKSLKYAFQDNLTEDEQAYLKTIILQAIKGKKPDESQAILPEQTGKIALFMSLGKTQKKLKYSYTGVKHLYDLDMFMKKVIYQTHLVKTLESQKTVAGILKALKTDMPADGVLHDDVVMKSLKKLIEKSSDFDTLSSGFMALSHMQSAESFSGYVSLKLNQYQTPEERNLWLTVLSTPEFQNKLNEKTLKALFPVFATWVNYKDFQEQESSADIVLGFMGVMQEYEYINTPVLDGFMVAEEDTPAFKEYIVESKEKPIIEVQDIDIFEALKGEAQSMQIAIADDTQNIEPIENTAENLLEEEILTSPEQVDENQEIKRAIEEKAERELEKETDAPVVATSQTKPITSQEIEIIKEKTETLSEEQKDLAFTPMSISSQAMLMEIEEIKMLTVPK